MSRDDDDDGVDDGGEQDVQAAFRAFMLSGNSPQQTLETPRRRLQLSTTPTRNTKTPPTSTPRRGRGGGGGGVRGGTSEQVAWKKIERKYWQILNAFQGTLQRSWLESDDHLGDVMSSIANLRMRIGMTSMTIATTTTKHNNNNNNNDDDADADDDDEWRGYGYRTYVRLPREDLEMALSHDLLKHESMMAGARTVLSSMAEAQEALGRRLEEMMLFHMMEKEVVLIETTTTTTTTTGGQLWSVVVEKLQMVYTMLASELYRKQTMVQDVLDSTNDDLLDYTKSKNKSNSIILNEFADKKGGLLIAEDCVANWSRRCEASAVEEQMLQSLLDLGDFRSKFNIG